MRVRVPAKVNLQLSVGPTRDDGYHDLVNVFHAVSLFDEVTATPADALDDVRVEGDSVDQRADRRRQPRRQGRPALAEHVGVPPTYGC